MKRFRLLHLVLLMTFAAVLCALALSSNRANALNHLNAQRERMEALVGEMAIPRHPSKLVITKPDGRSSGVRICAVQGKMLERRCLRRFSSDADPSGVITSYGCFVRYLGSDRDRDVYEVIVRFGDPFPAEPDDQTKDAVVRYVSYRGVRVDAISEQGYTFSIVPH